ncbi:ankyrin repeat domain-containing protein [Streptomyces sp. NPDC003077]|uniref:ankyrin repeat domain-containing protein n=1 Tax=Streptomyces sp. NPDC003077 TaxID=3154443 RepID=UPI0033A7A52F
MDVRLLDPREPLAAAAVEAIRTGDVTGLRTLLRRHPGLVTARMGDGKESRTLLHIATDWPGHFPRGKEVVAALIAAGADVGARFVGPHTETPLHWAASTDDVAVLDVLLDAGADIEADGAVIADGTPLADAVAFGQWRTARRLVERGARTTLWQAAALGETARVEAYFADPEAAPDAQDVTDALWCACLGGQRAVAAYLLERGGDVDWIGFDGLTALDVARREGHETLAAWLLARGARSAADPG